MDQYHTHQISDPWDSIREFPAGCVCNNYKSSGNGRIYFSDCVNCYDLRGFLQTLYSRYRPEILDKTSDEIFEIGVATLIQNVDIRITHAYRDTESLLFDKNKNSRLKRVQRILELFESNLHMLYVAKQNKKLCGFFENAHTETRKIWGSND